MQRQLGNGIFYWGIGQAPSSGKFSELRSLASQPFVLFSKQPSRAQQHDTSPLGTVSWTHFLSDDGAELRLPDHVAITSKARKPDGSYKTKHYALVCFSKEAIRLGTVPQFDIGYYENLGGKKIGNSQVTAIIQKVKHGKACKEYSQGFVAQLKRPYRITLTTPKFLSKPQQESLDSLMRSKKTSTQALKRFLKEIRAS